MAQRIPAGTAEQAHKLRELRWRGRTDLLFLANNILGYNTKNYSFAINKDVHQPLVDVLQQFPLPDLPTRTKLDFIHPAKNIYPYDGTPFMDRKKLPGKRRRLILDPRSFMKTTLNCICHSIQWLLNYPDISLLIVQSNTEKAEKILQGIKSHFLYNPVFREIYPDYCPAAAKKEFGNRQEFTLPNRRRFQRPEPSIMCASIDKAMSGLHFEVMKFSDIVDPTNVRTRSQIDNVNFMFEMFQKLLVDPDDFIDVEGTRYDFDDLYGTIIDSERKKPFEKRSWGIHLRGIYKKDTGGKPHTFSPEEMDLPYLTDKDGNYQSWWPDRFTTEFLEADRHKNSDSEEVFATQMLNNPLDVVGKRVFEVKNMAWIEPDEFAKVKVVYRTTTVDTAETQNDRSDYTAITTCAWDRSGRCYVEDIRHGRLQNDEVVDQLFDVWLKFKPISIKIEETGYVRGLRPTITRMGEKIGVFPLFEFVPRDTEVSKKERIKGFQPWFNSGDLRFLTNLKIAAKDQLKEELSRFPKTKHDDILDTIADQFQLREHFGRLSARKTEEEQLVDVREKILLGILRLEDFEPMETSGSHRLLDITGGL